MKKLLLGGACAASLLLALTPLAHAADMEPVPEPVAGMGWYISIFGGASWAKDQNFSAEKYIDSLNYFYLDGELEPDTGFMAGIAVGASFNDWLRGEVEFSGNFHDISGDAYAHLHYGGTHYDADASFDGDETALFALANLWLELPVGGAFRPYIGGGVGFGRLDLDISSDAYIDFSNSLDGLDLIDDSDWGFAYQIGGGVAFEIAENWAIDVGYRYKVINNAEFDLDLDDVDLNDCLCDGDSLEKDYKSHNLLVGLRFGF
jgi:opacity protein-like surface antigen